MLGDETLRNIARELVATVRSNVTIDWTLRENVRAQLRVLVKRILRKHGYPPETMASGLLTQVEELVFSLYCTDVPLWHSAASRLRGERLSGPA